MRDSGGLTRGVGALMALSRNPCCPLCQKGWRYIDLLRVKVRRMGIGGRGFGRVKRQSAKP